MAASKNNRSNTFRSCFAASHLMVMKASFQDHRKFSDDRVAPPKFSQSMYLLGAARCYIILPPRNYQLVAALILHIYLWWRALWRFNHNYVEPKRFHQWFPFTLPASKKSKFSRYETPTCCS